MVKSKAISIFSKNVFEILQYENESNRTQSVENFSMPQSSNHPTIFYTCKILYVIAYVRKFS